MNISYLSASPAPGSAPSGAEMLQDHLHLRLGRRLGEDRRVAQHTVVQSHLSLQTSVLIKSENTLKDFHLNTYILLASYPPYFFFTRINHFPNNNERNKNNKIIQFGASVRMLRAYIRLGDSFLYRWIEDWYVLWRPPPVWSSAPERAPG